jgi:hypothetical protein
MASRKFRRRRHTNLTLTEPSPSKFATIDSPARTSTAPAQRSGDDYAARSETLPELRQLVREPCDRLCRMPEHRGSDPPLEHGAVFLQGHRYRGEIERRRLGPAVAEHDASR